METHSQLTFPFLTISVLAASPVMQHRFPQQLCTAREGRSRHETREAGQPGVPLLSIKAWSFSSFFWAPEHEDPLCGSTIL